MVTPKKCAYCEGKQRSSSHSVLNDTLYKLFIQHRPYGRDALFCNICIQRGEEKLRHAERKKSKSKTLLSSYNTEILTQPTQQSTINSVHEFEMNVNVDQSILQRISKPAPLSVKRKLLQQMQQDPARINPSKRITPSVPPRQVRSTSVLETGVTNAPSNKENKQQQSRQQTKRAPYSVERDFQGASNTENLVSPDLFQVEINNITGNQDEAQAPLQSNYPIIIDSQEAGPSRGHNENERASANGRRSDHNEHSDDSSYDSESELNDRHERQIEEHSERERREEESVEQQVDENEVENDTAHEESNTNLNTAPMPRNRRIRTAPLPTDGSAVGIPPTLYDDLNNMPRSRGG